MSMKPGAIEDSVEAKSEDPIAREHDGTNAVAASGARLGILADTHGAATTDKYSKILLPQGEPDEDEGVANDVGGMVPEVGEDCEVVVTKGVAECAIPAQ